MAENVEKNQLPSKSVMSASYHELDTPPPEQDVDERTLFYLRMGVLHSYRTLFYETKVSTGPFEQVLTVGPTETVEVLVEVARRSTIEEESESKTESSEESQSEGRLTEELTDKVATVIQRSSTSSASLSVSGAYSVFSGSASGNSSYSNSRTDSTERVKRIVKETSQRVTNQFMKSFTLRTRRTEEVTTRDVHRRLIRNETDRSRHFGLRRLQQSYRASTQYRGPRLVWHVGVSYPGAALGTPRLISTDIVAGPFLQRAMRELKTAQQSARVAYPTAQGSQAYNLTPFRLGPDARMLSGQFDNSRQVIAVTSQGTDAGGNPWSVDFAISVETKETNPTTGEVSVQVVATKHATLGAPPASIQVVIPNIVVLYVSRALEATWATPAGATFKDFLDKYRALLIDMRSTKIRPSGDLRREERDELLRRALSGIQRFDPLFEINSFEIERLSTIFETDSAFYRLYPPYFSKRSFTDSTTSASSQSREYDLAQEQLPVPVGTSLGWRLQLDGDARRNEFLNSPLATVCVPIKQRRERDAVDLLKSQLGRKESPLVTDVIRELSTRWDKEDECSRSNLSEDSVDPTVVTPELPEGTTTGVLLPSALYPVRDVFSINEPLMGFAYEPLDL